MNLKKLALALCATLLAACLLAACGNASSSSPSQVTTKALNALKAGDTDTLASVYAGDPPDLDLSDIGTSFASVNNGNLTDEQTAIMQKLADAFTSFDFTVKDETINGDRASVDVEFKSYSLGDTITEAVTEYFSAALSAAISGPNDTDIENLIFDIIDEKVSGLSNKDASATATIQLVQQDGQWKVSEIPDDAVNAMTGNALESIEHLMDNLDSVLADAA